MCAHANLYHLLDTSSYIETATFTVINKYTCTYMQGIIILALRYAKVLFSYGLMRNHYYGLTLCKGTIFLWDDEESLLLLYVMQKYHFLMG